MFKNFIQKRLEKRVAEYYTAHPDIKRIAVIGNLGVLNTKNALATVISQKYRVRMEGDLAQSEEAVKLGLLGLHTRDDSTSLFEWVGILRAAKKRVKEPQDVDVVIQDLTIGRPGEVAHLMSFFKPTVAIISGVTTAEIDEFGDIGGIAKEIFTAANVAEWALINRDDVDSRFAKLLTNQTFDTYGTTNSADYRFEIEDFQLSEGYYGNVILSGKEKGITVGVKVVGEHSLRPCVAASAVAGKLWFSDEEIVAGLEKIKPENGSMNLLRGLEESTIIDDTRDASPASMASALQTIYSITAPERIVLLGSINDLGALSQQEHNKIGDLCDPNLLAWVVTVGEDAEKYLAPKARARGCQVKSFKNALSAGSFVHQVLEEDAIVLACGSAENIYLEESLKIIIHATEEDERLVRQSPEWLKRKNDFFATMEK